MIAPVLSLLMALGSASASSVYISISEVASGQPTESTSSFYYAAITLNATSDLAVDGDTNGDFLSGSCFSSDVPDVNPVWYVDLGENFNIYSVKIYNRGDCCADRLADFAIDVVENNPFSGDPGNVVNCGNIGNPGDVGLNGTIEITCPFQTLYYKHYFSIVFPTGRYIRITKTGEGMMAFCEIEVNAATNIFYKYSSREESGENGLAPEGLNTFKPAAENMHYVPVTLPVTSDAYGDQSQETEDE
ncbi:fucolectin-1-like [Haliotis rufescens]|uniref:fucolectin-1-like n=1 Tax=Haliotis rufescens TaxID=6454 RepID=UPI001EAFDE63|nr:fucolectin-1-like [Haliotis rufescens]